MDRILKRQHTSATWRLANRANKRNVIVYLVTPCEIFKNGKIALANHPFFWQQYRINFFQTAPIWELFAGFGYFGMTHFNAIFVSTQRAGSTLGSNKIFIAQSVCAMIPWHVFWTKDTQIILEIDFWFCWICPVIQISTLQIKNSQCNSEWKGKHNEKSFCEFHKRETLPIWVHSDKLGSWHKKLFPQSNRSQKIATLSFVKLHCEIFSNFAIENINFLKKLFDKKQLISLQNFTFSMFSWIVFIFDFLHAFLNFSTFVQNLKLCMLFDNIYAFVLQNL